jgi:hypothetical protein
MLRQSTQVSQALAVISANGFEPIAIVGDFVVPAGLAATDVIEMCILPAGYVPLDAKLCVDDADTGAALTLDVGVITGKASAADNARTCGNEAIAATTIGQTGGMVRDLKPEFSMLLPAVVDRGVGVKVGTGAAGLVVGARMRLTIHARPQINGV